LIRVAIAEDQSLLRQALVDILTREEDISVVGQVGRGDEVMALVERETPDVMLLDIEMPGRDGLSLLEDLGVRFPQCRALILTVFNRPGYLRRALDAGAAGFVLKDSSPVDLATAIRQTAAGEQVIDPKLAVATLNQGHNPLTEREREVLGLSRGGAAAAELAAQLGISEGTVRNHLSVAIQKMQAHTKTEAARVAEEKGWL
jgi:two-component system response regulator DesR